MSDGGTLGGAGKILGEAVKDISRSRSRNQDTKRSAQDVIKSSGIERVSFEEFLKEFKWRQGEHVTMLGTTGSGKTTTALELLAMGDRDYVVGFGTKRKDDTFNKLLKKGYIRLQSWEPIANKKKFALWPKIDKLEAREVKPLHHHVFGYALSSIYQQGGWCVFLDELKYLTDDLRLSDEVELLFQQGRSIGVSMLCGTQRPRYIPLVAYDQATHLFFWRENDLENIKRLGGIGYADRHEIEAVVANLPHSVDKGGDFLYLNTRTGEKLISKAEITNGGKKNDG